MLIIDPSSTIGMSIDTEHLHFHKISCLLNKTLTCLDKCTYYVTK